MAATTFQYQTKGSALSSAWTTETDKLWVKVFDALGLPMYAEIGIANPNSSKESTYDDYQRIRISEGDTGEYIFYGKIESTEPKFDPDFGQILVLTARDNSQELLKRTVNSRYTGYTKRSDLIKQIIIDNSYVSGTKNIDTTNATKFEDSAFIEAANNLDVDYRKSSKSALLTISELAKEDPWDSSKTGFVYDYFLETLFSGNTPTPFMHYFKRGSRPAGGALANGLTVQFGLTTETDQARSMLPDYSFSTAGGELTTKVRIEYTDLNGASQNKIVHLLATSSNIGTFTVGETITGAGLPAGITVEFVGSGFLIVTWSSTILTTGGTITGGSSGATRILDSVPRQTFQQDIEVVLRDYQDEDLDKARARAAELLYKRADKITRGEFGIVRWPYFKIAAINYLVRSGQVIRVINSNSGINSDMIVTEVHYDEGPGSFGARITVVGSARGEGISPHIIDSIRQQSDQGNWQNVGSIGGLPVAARFLEFTPDLNLRPSANQLNGALTAGATTITVNSTSEFPASGVIFIEAERITYAGKTATTFTTCVRGTGGTTAVAHNNAMPVNSPDTVVWDSTTARYSDGNTQSVNSGTYTMASASSVYWVYMTDGSATINVVDGFANSYGINRHQIALTQINTNTGKADVVTTHSTDPKIATGTLIANQISAFNADLGKITAGAIKLPSTSANLIDASELTTFTGFTLNGARIAGYNAGVLQAEIRSSDGKFYAGAGKVILASDGATIDNEQAGGTLPSNGVLTLKNSVSGAGTGKIWFNQAIGTVLETGTAFTVKMDAGSGLDLQYGGFATYVIDDAGFKFNRDLTLPSASTNYISRNSSDFYYNVSSGNLHIFRVNNVDQAEIGSDGTGTGFIFPTDLTLPAAGTTYISRSGSDIYHNVTTGNIHVFRVNNVDQIQIGSDGTGTGLLFTTSLTQPAGASYYISRVGNHIVHNVNDDNPILPPHNFHKFFIAGTEYIRIAPGGFEFSTASGGILTKPFIQRQTSGLIYDILTSTTHQFTVNGVKYSDIGTAGIGVGNGIAATGNGVNIGAASTNNDIWNASQGAGTATLYIGNASINTTSDIRLKKDIMPTLIDAYGIFRQLKVVDYSWNDPTDMAPVNKNSRGRWTGLIAQDMIDVVPFIVNAPDRNCACCRRGESCVEHNSYWFADFSHMTGIFVKGFQETDERILTLENRIKELEARLI